MSSWVDATFSAVDLTGLFFRPDPWLSLTARIDCYRVDDVNGEPATRLPRMFETALYTAQVDVCDVEALGALMRRGFRMVDSAVTLRSIGFDSALIVHGDPKRVLVRHAKASDLHSVDAIASSAFQNSRFHLDPMLPNTVANEIKRAWARNLVLGERGDGCLVASLDGKVVGFLGYLTPASTPFVIDLIAVHHVARGFGVGRSLVASIQRLAHSAGHGVVAGTQLANRTSLRMYEALGFRFEKATYILHGHTIAAEKS